ncbi:hypothetical protein P5673_017230 [Acropora cervicornis]|uniref:Uncharacterized protein n=1 Tax=Acropora cervicornis TaxID=6130 RepID=A0AAD9QG47_ACRCE|nr:hypothetical protein P5673_017230 [Acropora cervicornis]
MLSTGNSCPAELCTGSTMKLNQGGVSCHKQQTTSRLQGRSRCQFRLIIYELTNLLVVRSVV